MATTTRHKVGHLLKWGGKMKKEWKNYSFELNKANFHYFKYGEDNKPKKQAVVCDIVNIEQKDPQDGIFPFVVHFRKLPKWTLAASNEGDRQGWIAALNSVTNKKLYTGSPNLSRKSPVEDELTRRNSLPPRLTDTHQKQRPILTLEKNEPANEQIRLKHKQLNTVRASPLVQYHSHSPGDNSCKDSHVTPDQHLYEYIENDELLNIMSSAWATDDLEYVEMRPDTPDDSKYNVHPDDSEYVEMHLDDSKLHVNLPPDDSKYVNLPPDDSKYVNLPPDESEYVEMQSKRFEKRQ